MPNLLKQVFRGSRRFQPVVSLSTTWIPNEPIRDYADLLLRQQNQVQLFL